MSESIFRSGFVALTGLPNSGKSTLLNRLAGGKLSIVSPRPQTTRDNIAGIKNGPNFQAVFLDTPGFLKPQYGLQKNMAVRLKRALFEDSDIVCVITDPFAFTDEHAAMCEVIKKTSAPILLLINKMDKIRDKGTVAEVEKAYCSHLSIAQVCRISALTGFGVTDFEGELVKRLPAHEPYFPQGQWTDKWERFFVAELIREQIFQIYGEEIPYSCAVEIEHFAENPGESDVISAIVHVERASQKPIIIGAGGRKIKELREQSEREIEKFLGRKARVELFVKITPDWRNSPSALKTLGY
ncbi:MAG: GTPase Era [Elusimicrobia bacterium]|nr:GTPase Era [Elusimicrobiota bacterium]